MATSKLVINFQSASGEKVNHSFNYVDPTVQASTVRALAQGIITNGSIFAIPPATTLSAKVVTTTETEYDIQNS